MMISRYNLSMAHACSRVRLLVLGILLLTAPRLFLNPVRANPWATLAAGVAMSPVLVPHRVTLPPNSAVPLLWSGFWNSMESVLTTVGSERRMLQVATIGMCLALYILMRK